MLAELLKERVNVVLWRPPPKCRFLEAVAGAETPVTVRNGRVEGRTRNGSMSSLRGLRAAGGLRLMHRDLWRWTRGFSQRTNLAAELTQAGKS